MDPRSAAAGGTGEVSEQSDPTVGEVSEVGGIGEVDGQSKKSNAKYIRRFDSDGAVDDETLAAYDRMLTQQTTRSWLRTHPSQETNKPQTNWNNLCPRTLSRYQRQQKAGRGENTSGGTEVDETHGLTIIQIIDTASREELVELFRETEEAVHEVNNERDVALDEVETLKQENEKLRRIIDDHVENLVALHRDDLMEDAAQIAELAVSYGCKPVFQDDGKVHVCVCGNVLTADASFCRSCGVERVSDRQKRRTVMTLGMQLNEATTMLEKATSRRAALPMENVEWAELMDTETELQDRQAQKANIEAQLLVEVVNDAIAASVESDNLLDEEGRLTECPCGLAQIVPHIVELNTQLRALCTDLLRKLQRALKDSGALSYSLKNIQRTLDVASTVISESTAMTGAVEEQQDMTVALEAIAEAKQTSVFDRLYNNSTRRKQTKNDRQRKLMENSLEAVSGADFSKEHVEAWFRKERRPTHVNANLNLASLESTQPTSYQSHPRSLSKSQADHSELMPEVLERCSLQSQEEAQSWHLRSQETIQNDPHTQGRSAGFAVSGSSVGPRLKSTANEAVDRVSSTSPQLTFRDECIVATKSGVQRGRGGETRPPGGAGVLGESDVRRQQTRVENHVDLAIVNSGAPARGEGEKRRVPAPLTQRQGFTPQLSTFEKLEGHRPQSSNGRVERTAVASSATTNDAAAGCASSAETMSRAKPMIRQTLNLPSPKAASASQSKVDNEAHLSAEEKQLRRGRNAAEDRSKALPPAPSAIGASKEPIRIVGANPISPKAPPTLRPKARVVTNPTNAMGGLEALPEVTGRSSPRPFG
jgi:hypothetical protein